MPTPASPLPWSVSPCGNGGMFLNRERQTLQVWPSEDAAYIVHAANLYPKLVAALESMILFAKDYHEGDPLIDRAQAILAKAKAP